MSILTDLTNITVDSKTIDLIGLISDSNTYSLIPSDINISDSAREVLVGLLLCDDAHIPQFTSGMDDVDGIFSEEINDAYTKVGLLPFKALLTELGIKITASLNEKVGVLNNVFGTSVTLSSDLDIYEYDDFIISLLGVRISRATTGGDYTEKLPNILDVPKYIPPTSSNNARELLLKAKQLVDSFSF